MGATAIAGICALACTLGASVAAAAPITNYASTTVTSYNNEVPTEDLVNENPLYFQFDDDLSGGTANSSVSYTGDLGTGSAQAEAALTTGTLKAKAMSTSLVDTGAFDINAFAFARADIGDSFRTYDDNGLFQWSSDTEVTFSLDISGVASIGDGVNDRGNVGFFLTVYEAGFLDSYAQWLINVGPFPSDNSEKMIDSVAYSLAGDVYSFQDPFDVPGTVDFTFAPDGDFDWIAGITVDTAASQTNTSMADFFSTVELSYEGPEGTTTYSASGVFPGTLDLADITASVPEPATLGLLMAGLVGIGVIGRRRAPAA